ncbi:hypothetical protein BIFANG_02693 [Bifidobacterium angulatum DSM 20098 = JCM 7096]|uniref:Uncharacterized protein n=1 Tax=Bifidobacterium angulatum DSM 20098 = JCM 7096 TaxID=518635 RepID=C4FEF3_9BIFI|nr:hypothetical protein BIFANG_02693 [Bifidobacterium angulatum DSM 20098 = JCM 7096]
MFSSAHYTQCQPMSVSPMGTIIVRNRPFSVSLPGKNGGKPRRYRGFPE